MMKTIEISNGELMRGIRCSEATYNEFFALIQPLDLAAQLSVGNYIVARVSKITIIASYHQWNKKSDSVKDLESTALAFQTLMHGFYQVCERRKGIDTSPKPETEEFYVRHFGTEAIIDNVTQHLGKTTVTALIFLSHRLVEIWLKKLKAMGTPESDLKYFALVEGGLNLVVSQMYADLNQPVRGLF